MKPNKAKNKNSIKRYRPLWCVLAPEDRDCPDIAEIKALLSGKNTYIENLIDANLLSPKLVLNRIQKYAESEEIDTDLNTVINGFDWEKARADLLTSLGAIDKKESLLTSCGKEMDKLLLRMFELGTHVGAINLQDLAIRGKNGINDTYKANSASQDVRTESADFRREAYVSAFHEMEKVGKKITYNGLLDFLKNQPNKKFVTGVAKCQEIWVHENSVYDSQNLSKATSRSTIDRYKKHLE